MAAFLERLPALRHWRRRSTQTTWDSTLGSTPKWRARFSAVWTQKRLFSRLPPNT